MAKKTKKTLHPRATFTPVERVAPADRRGNSTIDNPVGVTWALCLNATADNDGVPPVRKDLHLLVMGAGVAYYTARTQVQRYLKWFNGGMDPAGLPRGITVG